VPIVNQVPERLKVTADAFLLKQAVQNLLSNALKYTEKGQIMVGADHDPYQVRFWVRDTGVGIPADRLPTLFIRMESDPTKSESSGLGLSIVKRIIDAHHGEIDVKSEPGKGSTFEIVLPHYTSG